GRVKAGRGSDSDRALTRPKGGGRSPPHEYCTEKAYGPRLFPLVLEGDVEAGAVERDLAVFDRHVQLDDLGDAQVADRAPGREYGRPRGRLPGLGADPDDLGDSIDAVGCGHCFSFLAVSAIRLNSHHSALSASVEGQTTTSWGLLKALAQCHNI